MNCPSWQGRNSAPAGDKLKNGNGELSRSPEGIDFRRFQDIAHEIEAFVRDWIGNQRLWFEIPCRQIWFANERMMMREQRKNLVGKQRMKRNIGSFLGMRDDHEVRPIVSEKSHRIGVEA